MGTGAVEGVTGRTYRQGGDWDSKTKIGVHRGRDRRPRRGGHPGAEAGHDPCRGRTSRLGEAEAGHDPRRGRTSRLGEVTENQRKGVFVRVNYDPVSTVRDSTGTPPVHGASFHPGTTRPSYPRRVRSPISPTSCGGSCPRTGRGLLVVVDSSVDTGTVGRTRRGRYTRGEGRDVYKISCPLIGFWSIHDTSRSYTPGRDLVRVNVRRVPGDPRPVGVLPRA